ncbi:MAG: TolC family protein [Candidatus Thiodiazotropha sp. (ex Dulcina madagascariensis)]|nr:TolC family protein [Candidatus Thiodiazotropha sp. (ex Dulcina madagascariensis)]MCU7928210.1 TolC family protein [Candidatus Thiodiazotropha sp. (ex Dulcina madagascariensis)]
MFSYLRQPGRFALSLIGCLIWQSGQANGAFSIDQAVNLALQGNPSLAEVQARAEAAARQPSQVDALSDPVLFFNAANLPLDSFDLTQEAMTQFQVGISQKLPWPGKLELRAEAMRLTALGKQEAVHEARLMLARDVRRNWWNLFYLDKALATVKDNQERLRAFVQVVEAKYRVGEGLQQDVLLAQVELSGQLERQVRLRGMRNSEAARLHALMAHPGDASVELQPIGIPKLEKLGDAEAWLQQALNERPLLSMKQHALDAMDRRLELSQKSKYPDFTLKGAYGLRGGDNPDGSSRSDFLTIGVSLNLPLYQGHKQDREVDQRNSERMAARYALDDARREVREQVERALVDYEQGREQARLLLNGIIPQTEQTVASMLAGYQVDKVDFLTLVRTQIKLNNFRIAYWKALSQAKQAEARLLAAVGVEMNHE